jgi:hypothetical protein
VSKSRGRLRRISETNVAIISENPTLPAVYLVLLALIARRRRDRSAAVMSRFRR